MSLWAFYGSPIILDGSQLYIMKYTFSTLDGLEMGSVALQWIE